MWRQDFIDAMEVEGISCEYAYNGGVRIDVGNSKAIEVSSWGTRFLFHELTWDETGGLISEEYLADTRSEYELVEFAHSLISEYV